MQNTPEKQQSVVTFYARARDGETKFDNVSMADGEVFFAETVVRGQRNPYDFDALVGTSESELIEQGFQRVAAPVFWDAKTLSTGNGPIDVGGHWENLPTPDTARAPGRPRIYTEPQMRLTVELPARLVDAMDVARASEQTRRAYIEAAIREKLERDQSA